MRTTLDIDDQVLAAAKDIARVEGRSTGAVASDLMRQALTHRASVHTRTEFHGFVTIPDGPSALTREHAQQLIDDDEA